MKLNLKEVRMSAGLTQAELAEKLCVTQQAVNNWEIGKTVPQADRLMEIAEVLNVPLLSLLYGDIILNYMKLDFTAEIKQKIKDLEERLKVSDTLDVRLDLLNEKEYYARHNEKCYYWCLLTESEIELYKNMKSFLSASEIVSLLNKRRQSLGMENTLIELYRCD